MGVPRISSLFLQFLFIHFMSFGAHLAFAIDFISFNQPLSQDQTITSKGNKFALGIYSSSSGASFVTCISIWDIWHTMDYWNQENVVWTSNSETKFYGADTLELRISDDGNLVLFDESSQMHIWSTNLKSISSNSTVAVILDSGNLVLRDGSDPNKIFWQSCDHPTDTWLPGCYLGFNKVTGENRRLTSRNDDFSPGVFSLEVDSSQLLIKLSDSTKYWSSGNLTNGVFSSAPNFSRFAKFEYISNETANYFTYSLIYNQTFVVFTLDDSGEMEQIRLADDGNDVRLSQYPYPPNLCGNTVFCGPFGICSNDDLNYCHCPHGFHVASSRDWNSGNRSGGCARNAPLGTKDMFSEVCRVSVLDDISNYLVTDNADNCKLACLSNCSCTAYLFNDQCYLWSGILLNLQTSDYFDDFSHCIYLRVGSTEMKKSNNMSRVVTFIILGSILGSIVCLVLIFKMIWIWKERGRMHKRKADNGTLVALRYRKLKEMTNDFSERLGGGGFGSVFKGMLPDSTVVAVKKLEGIRQGEKQFRSEVSTIGVIQHVNLVRLLGFCSEGTNKLLVYEHMPNGSLDFHLFRNTDVVLDWEMRYKIALVTARGLSYLHEGCRDCIIHCDIKPENILLDALFVPKVADFGLAKNVNRNFNSVLTTLRGTIGYLAPEWISGGSITSKADVYSYGMLLLEIISGRRNTQRSDDGHYFPVLAANKVVEGDVLSILDPRLEGNANLEELDRACKVACWCIQDNEVDRLSMGEVLKILEGIVEVNRPPIPKLLQALAENIESIIYFSDGKEEHFDVDISARPL